MQIAIGIGTLLLGGWVLTAPVDEEPADTVALPPPVRTQELTTPPETPETSAARNSQKIRERTRMHNGAATRESEDTRTIEERMQSGKDIRRARQQTYNSTEPSPPTSSYNDGEEGLPVPPTQALDEGAGGQQAGDESRFPTAPTKPASRRSGSPIMTSRSALDMRLMEQMRNSASYSAQAPDKAFANQRVFTSGVSPYMNLFRNDTAGGTIDNYSTYVRPALEQQKMNQQFNMDIYGLERNARLQRAGLQQLDRRSRMPSVIGTPQYYMGGRSDIDYGYPNQ